MRVEWAKMTIFGVAFVAFKHECARINHTLLDEDLFIIFFSSFSGCWCCFQVKCVKKQKGQKIPHTCNALCASLDTQLSWIDEIRKIAHTVLANLTEKRYDFEQR